jgi:hypothetical protein
MSDKRTAQITVRNDFNGQCLDKECYLTEEDQGTTHTFSVSPDGEFKINLISSGCTGDLDKVA